MSALDVLPDAPTASIDPSDWFMYHDLLIDCGNPNGLQLATIMAIADSLMNGPYLIPAVKIVRPAGHLILSGEHQDPDWPRRIMESRRMFVWLRSDWVLPIEPRDYYGPFATPYHVCIGSAFWSFIDDSKLNQTFHKGIVEPFFHTHSLRTVPQDWYISAGYDEAVGLFDGLR